IRDGHAPRRRQYAPMHGHHRRRLQAIVRFRCATLHLRRLRQSDVIVLIGSNLCIAHPIMWERVCRNHHRPTIRVIDPRKTETAVAATLNYAIKPKSDLVLLYAVANLLIKNGWVDRAYVDAHTTGFDEYAKHVADFTPEHASLRTGLSRESIEE